MGVMRCERYGGARRVVGRLAALRQWASWRVKAASVRVCLSGGMRCERWRGAPCWWVVVGANFSTCRLSDLSICWEVGKLES